MNEIAHHSAAWSVILLFLIALACVVLILHIMGTKALLRQLIAQVKYTNDLLQRSSGREGITRDQNMGSVTPPQGDVPEALIDRMERPFLPFAFTAPVIGIGLAIVILIALIVAYAFTR